jgi:DNA-binding CsgD family transcriptional regulator
MDEDPRNIRPLLIAILLVIVTGGVIDLILDAPTALDAHVVFELAMIAFALASAVLLWRGWQRAAASLDDVKRALERNRAERDAWRGSAQKLLDGLGRAIDEQFTRWGLTDAEREVALLLLKGYSHKAIAKATSRSEKTARQHAGAVYRKSGFGGRAELAAFFLEDLLLPDRAQRAAD